MKKILNYHIFKLERSANDFIIDRLKIPTMLSKSLLNKIDIRKGGAFTFFPDYIDEDLLKHYRNGGLLKLDEAKIIKGEGIRIINVPNTTDGLVDYIYNYLRKEEGIIVIENLLAKPNYDYVKRSKFKKVIVDEDVYYLLSNKDNKEQILDVIKSCSSKPEAIGIFTKNLDLELYFKQKVSGKSLISTAIENLNRLFIEAYDHEGYIIWEKEFK
jgi:hypothetical protein